MRGITGHKLINSKLHKFMDSRYRLKNLDSVADHFSWAFAPLNVDKSIHISYNKILETYRFNCGYI